MVAVTTACGSSGSDQPPPTSSLPTETAQSRSAKVPPLETTIPTPTPSASATSSPSPLPDQFLGSPNSDTSSTATLPEAVTVAPPAQIRIPAIEIDTSVQWVGQDAQGNMMAPSDPWETAWYQWGAVPGMPGRAVVAGHYDSTSGPAVFYRLRELQAGDEVVIRTISGQDLGFIVEAVTSYAVDEVPLDQVFGSSTETLLTLITCDGTFDPEVRQYDRRLVVYTRLATDPAA